MVHGQIDQLQNMVPQEVANVGAVAGSAGDLADKSPRERQRGKLKRAMTL